MTTPIEALASLAFGGVVSGGAWDLVKAGWARFRERSWEDLYLDAFTQAFNDMRPEFERYVEGGEIRFDRSAFQKLLHQNLVLDVGGLSLSDATRDELIREIATAIKNGNILIIGGHTLSDDSYAQLVRNLVERARATFREAVIQDTPAFRRAVLAESQGNRTLEAETQALLEQKLDITIDLLAKINQRGEETFNKVDAILQAQMQGAAGNFFQEQMGLRLTGNAKNRLEELKEAWREGNGGQVKRELDALKRDSLHWGVLEPGVKAAHLRFEASIYVSTERRRVIELAQEAKTLAPDAAKDAWLEAWLDHTGGDYASALGKLEGYNDLASVNFRAALLLEMDKVAEAERVLRLEDLELAPDAETYRIRALAGVMKKDLMQARRDAAEALALKPRWVGTRFSAAVVNYLSGVSPEVIDLTSPPIRIDPMFMKQDEDNRVHVGQAAAAFKELAEGAQDQPAERQAYEAWCLACLSHDPERRDEAIAYCRSLLAANPRHHQAIRWVFANDHQDDIPLEASRASLLRLVQEGEANVAEIVALVGCHLADEDAEAAARVVDETRTTFESSGSSGLWQFWRLQLMAAMGQTGPALVEINQATPDLYIRQARAAVVRKLAGESGDWRLLSVVLDDSFEQTRDPAFLVEGCQLRAKLGDWQYVADRAQTLIETIETADAVRLAAMGAYRAGRYQHCMALLEGKETYFPGGRFPKQLSELRVDSYKALGDVREAVAEAERLSGSEPSTENLIRLANLYTLSFDLDQAVSVARRLEDKDDLSAPQLLQLASLTRHRDDSLSARLWRRAVVSGLPDAMVGQALGIAFQLGLDEEVGELFGRAVHLAERQNAGLFIASTREFVPMFEARRETQSRVRDSYERGTLPVHAASKALNIPLIHYFHTVPTFNELSPDPIRQTAAFVRHGSRVDVSAVNSGSPLYLDSSALLLAHHLDILGAVEEAYGPLHVPQEVSYALLFMRDQIQDHQPSRFEAIRTIQELVRLGDVKVLANELTGEVLDEALQAQLSTDWVALYKKAKQVGGYLVDFLPLHNLDGPIPVMPEDAQNHLVNCRAVLNALPLAQAERDRLLEALGSAGQGDELYTRPERGRALFLEGNVGEVLADAGALRRVCDHFTVHIEQRTLDRLQEEFLLYDARREQLAWLDGLIGRLQRGVRSGTYSLLPEPPERTRQRLGELDDANFSALASLLGQPPFQNGVYWIDDRYLTASSTYQGRPIVGVNEVLKGLHQSGHLSLSEYYNRLERLRNGNFRFVPVEAEEVLYLLRQAPIESSGIITETPQLTTLRRYTAAWMQRANMLQRPRRLRGDAANYGELVLTLKLNRVVDAVLTELWQNGDDDAVCRACSTWILENLNIDVLGLRSATALQSVAQDDLSLAALSVMSLLTNALGMLPDVRERYFAWLNDRLLLTLFDGRPALVESVASLLKDNCLSLVEESTVPKLFIQLFFNDLPKNLREAIESDEAFMERMGAELSPVVVIDDLTFDAHAFHDAARRAVNGEPVELETLGDGDQVKFQAIGNFRIGFRHPRTGEGVSLGDFSPLLTSPAAREQALRDKRDWFDCPANVMEQAIQEILRVEDSEARLAAARAWQDASPALYYDSLRRLLSVRSSVPLKNFSPPDTKRLLWHFRLPETFDGDFAGALEWAASQLIEEEGLEAAIERLVCFPTPLPGVVIDSIQVLREEERLSLMLRLARAPRSPLSQLHFLRLTDQFRDESRTYRRLARRTAQALLNVDGAKAFEAFQTLLGWVSNESPFWPMVAELPPTTRLALVWAHTHQLFSVLVPKNPDLSAFTAFFAYQRRLSSEMLVRSPTYWSDIAHPHQLYHINFVLCGLSYALNDSVPPYLIPLLQDLLDPNKNSGMKFSYRDLSRAANGIASFLTTDFREAIISMVESEHRQGARAESFPALLSTALGRLGVQGEEQFAWNSVQILLGDLPPYPEAVQPLTEAVLSTDFATLTEQRPQDGLTSLHTASLQVRHLPDEARRHLAEQLVLVCRLLASQYRERGERDPEGALSLLTESVFNLSAKPEYQEDALVEASALLSRMIEEWPGLAANLRPIIQRFCEELPPTQAKHFWLLLIRLRAER